MWVSLPFANLVIEEYYTPNPNTGTLPTTAISGAVIMSPVHPFLDPQTSLSQRTQYQKPGVGRRYWDLRDAAILSWVSGTPTLDLGCGEGITLEKLVASGADPSRVFGIDLDPTNATICRQNALPFVRADLGALPIRSGSIGCVLWIEVIEHLDSPQTALQEIRRVLRPDGRLIVLFPNDLAMFAARVVACRWLEAAADPHHVRQWTPRSIRKLLKNECFRIEQERALPIDCWPWALHYAVLAIPGDPGEKSFPTPA